MTKSTSLRVQRMSDQLRHQELNFDNVVIHSRFYHFEKKVEDSGLSIKLGHIGEEHYFIDGQRHTIKPGRFLVVNRHRSFDCYLKSDTPVEAFCIYLSDSIIQDTAALLCRDQEELLDVPFQVAERSPSFLEKVYHVRENELGAFLAAIRPLLASGQPLDFESLYYTLAEKLLRSQQEIERQLKGIAAKRRSTREELYRRLSIARQYILENFHKEIDLDALSREAALSKYHLLRTYKEAFGTTPYRQVLDLRLESSKTLLSEGHTLEEIAYRLGFSDRRSYTKAFKKAFGMAPSLMRAESGV
ncbi:MAG: helix-turn-helix domain-containing protein [Phaeodactylibacter sp.]|nr:helix-turn-helix domain-containing protein [Phaeodactylibacter sp.]MCB9048598.1 helix-turn-helix transcriptional regulator [Lewinellaceae bacterium]